MTTIAANPLVRFAPRTLARIAGVCCLLLIGASFNEGYVIPHIVSAGHPRPPPTTSARRRGCSVRRVRRHAGRHVLGGAGDEPVPAAAARAPARGRRDGGPRPPAVESRCSTSSTCGCRLPGDEVQLLPQDRRRHADRRCLRRPLHRPGRDLRPDVPGGSLLANGCRQRSCHDGQLGQLDRERQRLPRREPAQFVDGTGAQPGQFGPRRAGRVWGEQDIG